LIGLMVLFWAMNFLIGKVALREFPDTLLAGLRVSLAGALISPVYAFRSRKAPASGEWRRDELPALIFLGFVGVALNQLCFIMGLHRTSVAHASLLMGMTPVMVLLIAAVIGQERITTKKVVGLAISLAGVAVLNHAPSKASGATPLGDLFIFLAATTFALFTVFGKRTTVRHGSVTVNTFAYVGGAMILSPVTIWQASRFAFSGLSAAAWASLLYMALFPSLICYLIYYYALTYIRASRISAFSYLQPLLATTLAALILKEPVTSGLVAGGALVLAGVYVVERA
jgi:drug/metabolite transporter (DMT)-like permease